MKAEVIYLLIEKVLPKDILNFFDISNVEERAGMLYVYLDEKNILPDDLVSKKVESKGFHEPKEIQDFPIRDKALYLVVKRRRWKDVETGKIYSRNWELVAKGTSYSKEFGYFLKKINRL
jgi:hypothetical protein